MRSFLRLMRALSGSLSFHFSLFCLLSFRCTTDARRGSRLHVHRKYDIHINEVPFEGDTRANLKLLYFQGKYRSRDTHRLVCVHP